MDQPEHRAGGGGGRVRPPGKQRFPPAPSRPARRAKKGPAPRARTHAHTHRDTRALPGVYCEAAGDAPRPPPPPDTRSRQLGMAGAA
ncbi:hypothetical protein Nmel_004505 [Mimus melanotis]